MANEFRSKPGGSFSTATQGARSAVAPGKRTLTSQLAARPGPIQRKAEGGAKAPSQDAMPSIEGSTGESLPAAVRGRFEDSLGVGLGDVRVHDGAVSAAAADSVSARAFTVGNDIHFAAGEYAPSSRSGQELLAHEVAHTVQQRGASPSVQHKLEVSSPGDALEHEADRAAGAMMLGAPASVSAVGAGIHRKEQDSEPAAEYVGANRPGAVLPNQQGTGEVEVGARGYSRQMVRSTAEISGHLAETNTVQDILLKPVVPVLDGIDAAIDTRQHDGQRMRAWLNSASGFFGHNQTKEEAQLAVDWVNKNMLTLIKDRDDEQQQFQAYNTWVPQANAFYSSITRLQAQMNLLGVGDDLDGMVAAIRQQIGMPHQDAEPAQGNEPARDFVPGTGAHAVGARATDAGQPLPVPPTNDTVTHAGAEASGSFRKMQTAYLGLQMNFHQQQIQEVNHQGDGARTRLDQINDVKKFIHNVGVTIDTTAAVVNGAPAAISNATDFVNRTGAEYGAMRNRRAIMRGEAARWNPTYTTLDEKGNMVIRNMQTSVDVNPAIKPGDDGRRTPSPGASDDSFTIPLTPGAAMDAIANFAFGAEIMELNELLQSIEARCSDEQIASEFLDTVKKVREYREAVNDYATKASYLQQTIAERRAQYLAFGEAMDAFAAKDRASQQAGEAPKKGGERYATVFALISSIREVTAVGNIAIGADDVKEWRDAQMWYQVLEAHRTDDGQPSPLSGYGEQSSIQGFSIPKEEREAISSFAGQAARFRKGTHRFLKQLTPIDAAAQGLFSQLSVGGGSHSY